MTTTSFFTRFTPSIEWTTHSLSLCDRNNVKSYIFADEGDLFVPADTHGINGCDLIFEQSLGVIFVTEFENLNKSASSAYCFNSIKDYQKHRKSINHTFFFFEKGLNP